MSTEQDEHDQESRMDTMGESSDSRTALEHEFIRASVVARLAHHGQTDKSGAPYIDHVNRVALALRDDLRAGIVAWLHDVLEDAPISAEDLRRLGFSAATVASVVLVSRLLKGQPYRQYIHALRTSGDAVAIAVKVADLRDHLKGNNWLEHAEMLRHRYEAALAELTAGLPAPGDVSGVDAVRLDPGVESRDDILRCWQWLANSPYSYATLRAALAHLRPSPMSDAVSVVSEGTPWTCGAKASTDPPQECDWPTCGCDPRAAKVIEALQESGALVDRAEIASLRASLAAAEQALKQEQLVSARLRVAWNEDVGEARARLTASEAAREGLQMELDAMKGR